MTNPEALIALAERAEKAGGRDLQLGHDILVAVGRRHPDATAGFGWPASHMDPTASLDAAMSLVPEGWHGASVTVNPSGTGGARCWSKDGTPHCVNAATPALALTAASLRAIANKEQGS